MPWSLSGVRDQCRVYFKSNDFGNDEAHVLKCLNKASKGGTLCFRRIDGKLEVKHLNWFQSLISNPDWGKGEYGEFGISYFPDLKKLAKKTDELVTQVIESANFSKDKLFCLKLQKSIENISKKAGDIHDPEKQINKLNFELRVEDRVLTDHYTLKEEKKEFCVYYKKYCFGFCHSNIAAKSRLVALRELQNTLLLCKTWVASQCPVIVSNESPSPVSRVVTTHETNPPEFFNEEEWAKHHPAPIDEQCLGTEEDAG